MRGDSRGVFIPLLTAVFVLLALALPARALEIPPAPKQWFTDTAGFVTPAEAVALDAKLRAFEQQSGAQFIIYTFPSLGGEAIEDFTIRAVQQWKVGQKKYDNGLVIFVFRAERKVRVEVGYGLEGTITDAFSSRVIREVMAPRFQAGDWAGGFNAGADAIMARITKGEAAVEPFSPRGSGEKRDLPPLAVLLIVLFVFFILVPMLSGAGRRRGGCGGCFWPMLFFPGGGGGITFGGGGGGGFGGFGGGGFSGGGGSFGGGGATGGW